MKNTFILFAWILLFFVGGCRRGNGDKHSVIVLQPLNNYDKKQISFIKEELQHFYQRKVIVLPDKEIPATFIDRSKGKRYAAPALIRWLSENKPDTAITVVGLTSEDIFTTKKDSNGKIKKPESTYAVWGVFGLGYCPGGSCVISDKRLMTSDVMKFRHRLRTVVIHEVGHNLGLPHCPQRAGCIMSDANEVISTVDNSSKTFCKSCSKKIGI